MKSLYKTIFLGVLCGLLIAGALFAYGYYIKDDNEAQITPTPAATETVTAQASPTPTKEAVSNRTDFSDVSERVMPAVVAVNVTGVEKYQDFFGRTFEREISGSGSGIIVGQNIDELLVVTNYHVVEGAKTIKITFIDGSSSKAEVNSVEENADLAVVSVSFSEMALKTFDSIRIATLGDSDELQIGEMVIAIGNALGYGQSTTVGYVSALGREIEIEGNKLTLIQTDTAINPGNSGGALLNARGEVVGINNAKLSAEGVEGMCFAIPVSKAIPIIEELITREEIPEGQSAYLGIVGQVISPEKAQAFNMPQGIYIKEVKEGSPAEKAGLKQGYIITKINNKAITGQDDYEKVLSYTRGGSEGTITVMVLDSGAYHEKNVSITFGTDNKH